MKLQTHGRVTVLLLFLISVHVMEKKKAFEFISSKDNNIITTATLVNIPPDNLPDVFVICSTHRQTQFNTVNTHSFYTIYEDEEFTKPWFMVGFWTNNTLWAFVKAQSWVKLSTLPIEFSIEWITVCIEIDVMKHTITSSIGGITFDIATNVTSLVPQPRLNLKLGKH